jgi:hypothetical protein
MSLYEQILDFMGGTPNEKMQEYAYLTGCILLILCCWALIKVVQWIMKI